MRAIYLWPLLAAGAATSEPAFPPGSAFGLEPFAGAEPARDFAGFTDAQGSTTVLVFDMPAAAFDEVASALRDAAALAARGITAERVESASFGDLEAVRVSGKQGAGPSGFAKCLVLVRGEAATGLITAQKPPGATGDACDLIAGVVERGAPTMEDKLEALPFGFGDLGGMRVVDVFGGATVIMTLGDSDQPLGPEGQPTIIAAAAKAPPTAGAAERKTAAMAAVNTLPGYSALSVETIAEETVADGPGVALRATARNPAGAPVRIAQWVRFGEDGRVIRLVAIAPESQWAASEPSFLAVVGGLRAE